RRSALDDERVARRAAERSPGRRRLPARRVDRRRVVARGDALTRGFRGPGRLCRMGPPERARGAPVNRPPFREGLTQLGDKVYAYLQPDGGLGLSNAGLVASRGASSTGALLVDTFFDLAHTQRLLDAIARQVGAPIRRVLNTHANGDHCWGNQLVRDAEIIGHR